MNKYCSGLHLLTYACQQYACKQCVVILRQAFKSSIDINYFQITEICSLLHSILKFRTGVVSIRTTKKFAHVLYKDHFCKYNSSPYTDHLPFIPLLVVDFHGITQLGRAVTAVYLQQSSAVYLQLHCQPRFAGNASK